MRATSVRFPDDEWERIQAEAQRTGVSAGQVVRDSTLAWFAYREGRAAALALEERVAEIEARLVALERRS